MIHDIQHFIETDPWFTGFILGMVFFLVMMFIVTTRKSKSANKKQDTRRREKAFWTSYKEATSGYTNVYPYQDENFLSVESNLGLIAGKKFHARQLEVVRQQADLERQLGEAKRTIFETDAQNLQLKMKLKDGEVKWTSLRADFDAANKTIQALQARSEAAAELITSLAQERDDLVEQLGDAENDLSIAKNALEAIVNDDSAEEPPTRSDDV